MCTGGERVPGSAAEALALVEAGLDYLTGPAAGDVVAAELAGILEALSRTGAKHAAAWNTFLARFDASGCHDEDGYQSSAAWLAGRTRTKLSAARGRVRQMRTLSARPVLGQAMAGGRLSESWAGDIIVWTRPLPPEMRDDIDRILLDAAEAGAELDDLAVLARAAVEQWKSQRPDPDEPGPDGTSTGSGPDGNGSGPGDGSEDGFEDRRLTLDHTFGGAGRLTGDLTPECSAALQAVLDALGKKRGPADTRTRPQRLHDGMQEACELLIRAKMIPDRAGSDTRVDAVISLGELLSLPGAGAVERAWLASAAGHHIYLSGTAAEAISCDALITPVVTGTADWTAITAIIDLVADALTGTRHATGAGHDHAEPQRGRDQNRAPDRQDASSGQDRSDAGHDRPGEDDTRPRSGSGRQRAGGGQDRTGGRQDQHRGGGGSGGPGSSSGHDRASREEGHADDGQDPGSGQDRSASGHNRPGREEDRTGDRQDGSDGQDHSKVTQDQDRTRTRTRGGGGSGRATGASGEQDASKGRDRASGSQDRSGAHDGRNGQDRSSGRDGGAGHGHTGAQDRSVGRHGRPGEGGARGDGSGQPGSDEPGHRSSGQGSAGSQATGTGQHGSEGPERLNDGRGSGGEDDASASADGGGNGSEGRSGLPAQHASWPPAQPAALALAPEAWEALLHEVGKLAVRFVSGPGGLASALRRALLPYPCNARSVPLDVGLSQNIPEPIRRAVQLRDRKCRWPGGCDRPPSACDVHHVKHKKDGGPTSVSDCLLLCQYHHDICIHRRGWEIQLHAGGEVTARGPRGQLLPSHGYGHGPPPPARAA